MEIPNVVVRRGRGCLKLGSARDINPFVVNFGKYLLIVVYSDRM